MTLEYIEKRVNRAEITLDNLHTILVEIREQNDLDLKAKATILNQLAIQSYKIDTILEILNKKVTPQTDAARAKRERTWSE